MCLNVGVFILKVNGFMIDKCLEKLKRTMSSLVLVSDFENYV